MTGSSFPQSCHALNPSLTVLSSLRNVPRRCATSLSGPMAFPDGKLGGTPNPPTTYVRTHLRTGQRLSGSDGHHPLAPRGQHLCGFRSKRTARGSPHGSLSGSMRHIICAVSQPLGVVPHAGSRFHDELPGGPNLLTAPSWEPIASGLQRPTPHNIPPETNNQHQQNHGVLDEDGGEPPASPSCGVSSRDVSKVSATRPLGTSTSQSQAPDA